MAFITLSLPQCKNWETPTQLVSKFGVCVTCSVSDGPLDGLEPTNSAPFSSHITACLADHSPFIGMTTFVCFTSALEVWLFTSCQLSAQTDFPAPEQGPEPHWPHWSCHRSDWLYWAASNKRMSCVTTGSFRLHLNLKFKYHKISKTDRTFKCRTDG